MPGARLTVHDRGVIERAMRQGLSVSQIAALVGKHRTTVARELATGSGSRPDRIPKHPAGSSRRGTRGRSAVYHAWVAQARAAESARRPKEFKLSGDLGLVLRSMPTGSRAAAFELFAVLRELDSLGVGLIWVEQPPPGSEWDGVRDRLQRAAAAAPSSP